MSITITGKNFKLSNPIKVYVTKQLQKVKKISPVPVITMKAELDVDKNQRSGLKNRVEMSVELAGKTIKAGHKAEHMREAIDLCIPKLLRQVRRFKEKRAPKRTTIRNS